MRLPALGLVIALLLAACGGDGRQDTSATSDSSTAAGSQTTTGASSTASQRDSDEIVGIAKAWYAEADPSVCDEMTDKLLEFGWKARGAKGKRACRASIDEAEPVGEVSIDKVSVDGGRSVLDVHYALDGKERIDRLRFVRRGGAWLVDEVSVVTQPGA